MFLAVLIHRSLEQLNDQLLFISAASCQMDGRAMEEARQLCQGHKASAVLDGKRKTFVRSATSR